MAKKAPKKPVRLSTALPKLEEAFAMGCSVLEACLYANVTRAAYYKWIKEKPELVDRFDELRETPVLKARKAVMDDLNNGDVNTAKWYLQNKKSDEFNTKQEIDHSGLTIQINGDDAKL